MHDALSSFIIHYFLNRALKNKGEPAKFQVMKGRKLNHKNGYLILILLLLSSSVSHGNNFNEIPSFYQPLVYRLSQDGFDFEFLSKLFTDPRAESIPGVTTISLYPNETPERYTQFLSTESILLSKQFLRNNLKTLRQMEKRFQVDKEVAVAILLVESRFGENIGRYRVMPTLASLALIDSSEILRKNCDTFREIDPELSCEWIESWSRRKAEWAYQELKCFLNIIRQEKVDPLEIYGSHAGALGMAQFIPSSYLAYAQNRKGLEQWLLSREEAIFSIGNYLKSHGWKKNLPEKKKKQILWCYNRSEPYVETVLKVAQKIRH
jgi:membrane-bound lytic murein transglycosylase B